MIVVRLSLPNSSVKVGRFVQRNLRRENCVEITEKLEERTLRRDLTQRTCRDKPVLETCAEKLHRDLAWRIEQTKLAPRHMRQKKHLHKELA